MVLANKVENCRKSCRLQGFTAEERIGRIEESRSLVGKEIARL